MHDNAFAPSGRTSSLHHTQGDALGYGLVAPSGRASSLHHTQGDALGYMLVAPSGRTSSLHHTQGDALGYVLVAPSGRALNACAYSLIQLEKLEFYYDKNVQMFKCSVV